MTKTSLRLKQIVSICVLTLFIFISSKISFRIPGIESVAPVTAQTLVLSLIVYYFLKWQVLSAVGLFIILGIAGLPMFSEGACCFKTLVGNSGGYIYGFLLAAYLMKTFHEGIKANLLGRLIYLVLYTAYVLMIGFIHLSFMIGVTPAWQYGIQPYLIGAVFKVMIAWGIIELIRKYAPSFDHC